MSLKKILMTGGGGYIGSYLLSNYLSDYRVTSLDHGTSYEKLNELVGENVELVKGDIRDEEMVEDLIKGKDIVVHLAADRGEGKVSKNLADSVETSVLGTYNLIVEAKKRNVEKFIFASTYVAYSTLREREMPLYEADQLLPDDNYGSLKARNEADIINSGIPHVIMRLSNSYGFGNGVRKGPHSVVDRFIQSARMDNEINVFGDGKQGIDLLYIDDMCEAIVKCIGSKKVNEIYNIGSGRVDKIMTIAEAVKTSFLETLNRDARLNFIPAPKDKVWPDKWMSIEKISTDLNWKPKTSLFDGVKKTTENFLKARATDY